MKLEVLDICNEDVFSNIYQMLHVLAVFPATTLTVTNRGDRSKMIDRNSDRSITF